MAKLPYSDEAEKQVIANMLFSQDILIDTLARLGESDFYFSKNRVIYKTILDIPENERVRVDATLITEKLSIAGKLEEAGGANYIFELINSYNDSTNAKYYIDQVEELSTLRQLIDISSDITNNWQSAADGDISSFINQVEGRISNVIKGRKVEGLVTIEEAFTRYSERLARIKDGSVGDALKTGYPSYDKVLGGFKKGEVTILAARPSVGKTAFALNLLFNVAKRTTSPCVFFSLEMGIDQVINRIIASQSGVPQNKVANATFDMQEESSINKVIRDFSKCNLFIDETSALKVADMRSKLNKLQTQYGSVGLVVVDYLGLIKPDVQSKGDQNRSLELGRISAALKGLARDFKCPVLVLSQLNREIEKSKDREPQLSDLRESGSIEQDADVVLFIHRPDYGKTGDSVNGENGTTDLNAPNDSPVAIIISKNRNGQSGAKIDFLFEKHIGKFSEIDKYHHQ